MNSPLRGGFCFMRACERCAMDERNASACRRLSEGTHEFQYCFLVLGCEFAKIPSCAVGFAAVAQYRIPKSDRSTVVHESNSKANAPERRSTHPVLRPLKIFGRALSGHTVRCTPVVFYSRNHNSITRSHIMQQEIAKWMEGLAPQSGGNGECSTVDSCAG